MDKFVIKTNSKRKSEESDTGQTSKRTKYGPDDIEQKETVEKKDIQPLNWRRIRAENLNCDYTVLYATTDANELLAECERTLDYNTGQLARVQIFGQWHDIPRKQVAHGDDGLSYTFSNNTVPARPWTPMLERIRDRITEVTGFDFNFVLINRYKDGRDHMGEHCDDEKDLVGGYPIASLSIGQCREFVFKHADARGKNATRKIEPVKLELENGSLLLMKYPTNTYWYHSLPPRKRVLGVRLNMTFRKMVAGQKKVRETT